MKMRMSLPMSIWLLLPNELLVDKMKRTRYHPPPLSLPWQSSLCQPGQRWVWFDGWTALSEKHLLTCGLVRSASGYTCLYGCDQLVATHVCMDVMVTLGGDLLPGSLVDRLPTASRGCTANAYTTSDSMHALSAVACMRRQQ